MKFGEKVKLLAVSFHGKVSTEICRSLTESIVEAIGLKCIPGQILYSYPYEGKGGSGFTLLQPVTESMVTWDIWTDHIGGYLFVVSCKSFDPKDVTEILTGKGLKIMDSECIDLSLRGKNEK